MEIDTVENAEADLRELMAVTTKDIQEEIKNHNSEIIALVKAMGGSAGSIGARGRKESEPLLRRCTLRPKLPRRLNFDLS